MLQDAHVFMLLSSSSCLPITHTVLLVIAGVVCIFCIHKRKSMQQFQMIDTVLAQEIAQGGSLPPLQHSLQKGCSWDTSCPPSISNSDKERLQKCCFKTTLISQLSWKIQEDFGGSTTSTSLLRLSRRKKLMWLCPSLQNLTSDLRSLLSEMFILYSSWCRGC